MKSALADRMDFENISLRIGWKRKRCNLSCVPGRLRRVTFPAHEALTDRAYAAFSMFAIVQIKSFLRLSFLCNLFIYRSVDFSASLS